MHAIIYEVAGGRILQRADAPEATVEKIAGHLGGAWIEATPPPPPDPSSEGGYDDQHRVVNGELVPISESP